MRGVLGPPVQRAGGRFFGKHAEWEAGEVSPGASVGGGAVAAASMMFVAANVGQAREGSDDEGGLSFLMDVQAHQRPLPGRRHVRPPVRAEDGGDGQLPFLRQADNGNDG